MVNTDQLISLPLLPFLAIISAFCSLILVLIKIVRYVLRVPQVNEKRKSSSRDARKMISNQMTTRKVAVVAGAQRPGSIGFQIVKKLCQKFDGDVILTSTETDEGYTSVLEIRHQLINEHNPKYHRLDIKDEESIKQLRDHLLEHYGGLNILINCESVYHKKDSHTTREEIVQMADDTIMHNYFGTQTLIATLLPILKTNGRVVNLIHHASNLSLITNKELRTTLASDSLDLSTLNELVVKFLSDVKVGDHHSKGWPKTAFAASAIFVVVLSRIFQKTVIQAGDSEDITINCLYTGDTVDRVDNKFMVEEGAECAMYLTLYEPEENGPKGQLFGSDMKNIDWTRSSPFRLLGWSHYTCTFALFNYEFHNSQCI